MTNILPALEDNRDDLRELYEVGPIPGRNGVPHPGSMYDAIIRVQNATEVTRMRGTTRLGVRTDDEGSRGSYPDNDGTTFEFGSPEKGSPEEAAMIRGLAAGKLALENAKAKSD